MILKLVSAMAAITELRAATFFSFKAMLALVSAMIQPVLLPVFYLINDSTARTCTLTTQI
jgi:hypothetical protein